MVVARNRFVSVRCSSCGWSTVLKTAHTGLLQLAEKQGKVRLKGCAVLALKGSDDIDPCCPRCGSYALYEKPAPRILQHFASLFSV